MSLKNIHLDCIAILSRPGSYTEMIYVMSIYYSLVHELRSNLSQCEQFWIDPFASLEG